LSSNGSATFEIGANLASMVVGTAFTLTSGNANFDSGVLFVDGTNNRVGIGTTSPGQTFTVNGPVWLNQTADYSGTSSKIQMSAGSNTDNIMIRTNSLYLYNYGNTGETLLRFGNGVETWNLGTGAGATPDFKLYELNGTSTRIMVKAGGNVGIGTTSPWERLSIPFNNGIALGDNTYSFKIQRSSAGELVTTFSDTYNASTARIDFTMRSGHAAQNTPLSILGSGNVGIGNTTPSHTLSVTGTTNLGGVVTATANVILGTTTISANGSVGTAGQILTSGGSGNVYWSTGGGGGSPGGANTQIQFNDGGSFGGDAGLTYNKTTDALTVAGALTVNGAVTVPNTAALGNTTVTGFANVSTTATIGTGFTLTSGNANFDSGVLFVDGTNNRVGVGTTSPTFKLETMGEIKSSISDGDKTGITIGRVDTSRPKLEFNVGDNSARFKFEVNGVNTSDERLGFFAGPIGSTATSEALTLSGSGNVGIGTSSPLVPLHVYRASGSSVRIDTDASASSTQLNFAIAGTNKWSLYRPNSSADLRLFDNATAIDVMTWQVGGNVGIGTTSPSSKLDVVGSGVVAKIRTNSGTSENDSGVLFNVVSSGTSADRLAGIVLDPNGANGIGSDYSYIVRDGSGNLDIVNQGAERMRITSAGNVGIGTTNPGYKLEVNGSFAATTKSFVIDHPTKPDMKLRYGSLEGPENGVYVRGRSKGDTIELPDYWTGLVDEFSITVNLTPIGSHQKLYVKSIDKNVVTIGGGLFDQMEYFYTVFAERKDVDKLIVEI
jgi:hypothetical protein